MNLKLYEAFVAVARLGGFRAAAEHLNSTQPAISMRIRELERLLGIALFERAHRASFLTAKGEALLPYAERLLGAAGEVLQQVEDSRVASETVRVGVSELIAVTWLSDLTEAIGKRFPNVSLRFDIDLIHGLTAKLRDRALDLVLCAGPLKEPGLKTVFLGTVRLDWFASPQLGLRAGRLGAKDLAQFPLISLSPNSSLHLMALEWFRDGKETCYRTNFCNSMNAVSLLVRAGLGVSILPTEYYELYTKSGDMRILETMPALPAIDYLAAYYQTRVSPVVAKIAQLAAEISLFQLPARERRRLMRQKLLFSEMSQGAHWRATT